MAFGLTIGTERAQALQDAIQAELLQRGYGQDDADSVMAEYITIMLINNKAKDQITAELDEVLGAGDYDASFTDWLFAEAARNSAPDAQPTSSPSVPIPDSTTTVRDPPPHVAPDQKQPQASLPGGASLSSSVPQAIPSTSQTGSKRTASARSPSPNLNSHPNKSRRTDGLPTAPRAMHREGSGGRSLLERMGGRPRPNFGKDDIQARIDAVTSQQTQADMMAMNAFNSGMGGMGGMGGMMMGGGDMGAAMGGMVNPMALQEMMMNQMALMAQMANNMGMLNPQAPMMMGQNGFPMVNGANGGFDGAQAVGHHQSGGFRGSGRGRGRGGSGGAHWNASQGSDGSRQSAQSAETATIASTPISAPTPKQPAPGTDATLVSSSVTRPGFVAPERPQSPTLCKFALKCSNASCRYSHPSPVATAESGVVLSNDHCEAGKDCKDKDCIKAHVSPAVVNGATLPVVHHIEPVTAPAPPKIPCRYGASCMRITTGCPFTHPKPTTHTAAASNSHFNQQCRFGAGCTRAACPFQHPEGRVLPTTFHRGLGNNTPAVTVQTPHTGSIGGPSHNKSMVFNKPASSASTLAKKAGDTEKKLEKAEAAEVEATVASASTVEAAA